MIVTFVDSGVLIAAARGQSHVANRAFGILDDANRVFASSAFVRLEVLPKAVHQKRSDEVSFYEAFFAAVTYWAEITPELMEAAFARACHHGLSALDALRVAAAEILGAAELVTSERSGKPIHRAKGIHITSISEPMVP